MASRNSGPTILGPEYDAQLEQQERLAVERVLAGHQSNARADQILSTAFGGDYWRPIIQSTPKEQRRAKFVELYEEVLRKAGATHLLRFAVTTEAGRHKYTLVHASKHERAFAAMKDAMHRARGQLPKSETPPSLFDAAPSEEPELSFGSVGAEIIAVADQVEEHFAGRTIRWTGEYGDATVKNFARDKTPLFPHEYPELQAELTKRGYVVLKKSGKVSRPLEYRLPAK